MAVIPNIKRLMSRPTNDYGTTKRGKTVTTLSVRKKGSTPPGIRIGVRVRGRR